jgi:hypothetical protein
MADVTLRNIKEAVPETVIIRGVSGAFGVTHILEAHQSDD